MDYDSQPRIFFKTNILFQNFFKQMLLRNYFIAFNPFSEHNNRVCISIDMTLFIVGFSGVLVRISTNFVDFFIVNVSLYVSFSCYIIMLESCIIIKYIKKGFSFKII